MGGDCCERQKMRVISSNDNIAPLRREQVCMGGGVVTGLILQGSLSLYACYMSNKLFQDIYNLILENICSSKLFNTAFGTWRTQYWPKDHDIFRRYAISFQENLLFCLTGWKKKNDLYSIYNGFDSCNAIYMILL